MPKNGAFLSADGDVCRQKRCLNLSGLQNRPLSRHKLPPFAPISLFSRLHITLIRPFLLPQPMSFGRASDELRVRNGVSQKGCKTSAGQEWERVRTHTVYIYIVKGVKKTNYAKKPYKYKCCKDDFVYLWLIEKESN